jgi:hypothetical protein
MQSGPRGADSVTPASRNRGDERRTPFMAIQRVRAVNYAVPGEAVVTASGSDEWMVVQGLNSIGYATWHMTIFPVGQENWSGTYRLPANGTRPIKPWMQYDEFHLTSPEKVHFYYTDECVPLRASLHTGAKSPDWSERELWAHANYLCAYWFSVDMDALNAYVADRPRAEAEEARERKIEEAHQDRLWQMYKKWVITHPELYAKTQISLVDWVAERQGGFLGSHVEFREVIEQDYEDYMRADVNPGKWRDDEGGYGYE